MLRTNDDELRDVTEDAPALIDAESGEDTGIRLVRWLGAGGMAAVLLGELDARARWAQLSPLSPPRVAVKFTRPSTDGQLRRLNLSPIDVYRKEVVALGRVMERKPPTEFVLGLFGSGTADVETDGRARRLPWMALEYVDGGTEGATLTDRAARSGEGIDPVRALRLVRGILEGVAVLHEIGVLHRDLKPDNVFIAGPIDDETPKIADCGIARVDGLAAGTIAALSPAYGGPEQMLSAVNPTERNMLIGPWTDVHAAAAVVWFILGNEDWCRSEGDRQWHDGVRRTLRSSRRLHPGFATNVGLVDAIDAVLARGAAHRLSEAVFARPDAAQLTQYARLRFRSMFVGPERHSSIAELQRDILPLLEDAARQWTSRAVRENRAATAFRPTRMLGMTQLASGGPPAVIHEIEARTIAGTASSLLDSVVEPAEPGSIVFQPDGKILARFGERILYFVGDRPHKVGVPDADLPLVAASKWVTRGPGGGFALVGPAHVLLVRGGAFTRMPLCVRTGGGEVGAIQAVIGDGRMFGVVTAETDDGDGGPELWTSTDGATWAPPRVLPLGGNVAALANGAYGCTVVGSKNGRRARALHLGLDGQVSVFTTGVNDRPPLVACVSGAGRESWAAGQGFVLRFDPSGVAEEKVEDLEPPVAMGLDLVGVPWLVTPRAVLRRHDADQPIWKLYYRRDAYAAPLIAIGFSSEGARVLDTRGRGARIVPSDVEVWSRRSLQRVPGGRSAVSMPVRRRGAQSAKRTVAIDRRPVGADGKRHRPTSSATHVSNHGAIAQSPGEFPPDSSATTLTWRAVPSARSSTPMNKPVPAMNRGPRLRPAGSRHSDRSLDRFASNTAPTFGGRSVAPTDS